MSQRLPHHVPLIAASRGASIENVHYGSIAVCDVAGELLFHVGDFEYPVFTRSTLKPFQALPFVLDDGPARLGFAVPEIALICASHSGEQRHVEGVAGMLRSAAATPAHLQCGCHPPLHFAACGIAPPPGFEPSALHHNCSGKHAGFLAYCRLHDLPAETYLAPEHPLQQRIRQVVAALAGRGENELPCATDGCSAPNYAMPLPALARGYARLAAERENALGAAFATLFEAMTGEPEMVSGQHRADAALMRAAPRNLVAKGGADGIQAFGVRSSGLGIAIKISDGNAAALRAATASVLEQLGLLPQPDAFRHWSDAERRNDRGMLVGRMVPLFRLESRRR